MLFRTYCATCNGINATTITIETDCSEGVGIRIVGLPADGRNLLPEFETLDFIREGRNIVMYGKIVYKIYGHITVIRIYECCAKRESLAFCAKSVQTDESVLT